MSKRVLFVCEGNLHRSPTAERLYSATPGIDARSAGLSNLARVQVTDDLVAWADVVVVMEGRLLRLLTRRFPAAVDGKEVVALGVAGQFSAGPAGVGGAADREVGSGVGAVRRPYFRPPAYRSGSHAPSCVLLATACVMNSIPSAPS